jgi:F-type H+-transporting ATPase subunit c
LLKQKFTDWGATISAGIIAFAASFGISKIGTQAINATARQPEAANDIRTTMIVSAALIEGVSLFGVIVCLMAFFF